MVRWSGFWLAYGLAILLISGVDAQENRAISQAQQLDWQQAAYRFSQADRQTVLIPYMNIIAELSEVPQAAWCYPQQLTQLDLAIDLNPSSLIARAWRYRCAHKINQTDQERQDDLDELKALIAVITAAKPTSLQQNVIEVRELMEAKLLLQFMGYSILDVDLVSNYGGLYYRYHVLDLTTQKTAVQFFSNLQFMKRLLFAPDISDVQATELVLNYYQDQQLPFAINRQASQLMYQQQYEQAETLLLQSNYHTMHKTVLLAQIYLATEQPDKFEEQYPLLLLDAKSGYIPASLVLSQWYLQHQQMDKLAAQLAMVDHFNTNGEGAYQLATALIRQEPKQQQSLDWYQQAVDAQHVKAMLAMGRLYAKGQLVAADMTKALQLLKQAYALGSLDAGVELVNHYHLGSPQYPADHQQEMRLLQQLVVDEYPMAYVMLGKRYAQGMHVEQDHQKAFTWLEQAYQLGESQAANPIAIMYEQGLLADGQHPLNQPNYQMASLWYQRAGERGDSNGYINLARLALYGLGREKSVGDAEQLYVKAVEAGSIVAYCRLADSLLIGGNRYDDNWAERLDRAESLYLYGSKRNFTYCPRRLGDFYQRQRVQPQQAQSWYEKSAKYGDDFAQRRLERIYLDSYLAADHQQALSNFTKGAAMGLVKSSFYLGKMYHLGLGTQRNDQQALTLWQMAAAKGFKPAKKALIFLLYTGQPSVRNIEKAQKMLDEWAQESVEQSLEIAEWFFNGNGIEKNYRLALRYYRQAAASGSAVAINQLGDMYRFGWGLTKNYQQAMAWYVKGQALDDLSSTHNIAEMYYYGIGVSQDLTKAAQLFKATAHAGFTESQYFLGLMNQHGQGVSSNIDVANQWFNVAMNSRHSGAKFMFAKNLIDGKGLDKNVEKGLLLIVEAAEAGYQPAIDHLHQLR